MHPKWTLEQKKDALWNYIALKFKIKIPRHKVCDNHVPPFEFVAAAFFELYSFILALGPRLGGKTLDFAILAVCEAIANDECELANFGAVEAQAMRCYGYIKRFFEKEKDLSDQLKGKITLSKTELLNESWMQVLVATLAGVNSPHPQKLKADEVELIPWNILQEAWNMPQSTDKINATTVLGSTRKFAHGPMQRLLDDKVAQTFTFCIWEVMEKWPDDPIEAQRIIDAFEAKYPGADILPADKTKFNGFFKWRDLCDRIKLLDEETLRAQVLCEKPESGGLIYPKFDEVLNVDADFKKRLFIDGQLQIGAGQSIQIWEDFGYARPDHPNAIGLVLVDLYKKNFTIFDELYIFESSTQDILIKVIQMLQKWHLVPKELQEVTATDLLDWKPEGARQVNYAPFFQNIRLWIPDYHGLTEIADRQKYGCPIPAVYKITHEFLHPNCAIPKECVLRDVAKMYEKENGIPHVRNFVDDRTFKITDDVVWIRGDFLSYTKRRKPDGTWTDDPEKKNDHGPDLVHYGAVYNWPTLAIQGFTNDPPQVEEPITATIGGDDISIGSTLTGDLMEKVF